MAKKSNKKVTQPTGSKVCNCVNNETYVGETDRLRAFSLQLYASPEHWGSLLSSAKHYAYVLHDKDVNSDGTLKTPHYHVLVVYENAKTKSAVEKLTNIKQLDKDTTINFQRLLKPKNAFRYLMHDTPEAKADGKYLYPFADVKYDSSDYWCYTDCQDDNEEFISDLLAQSMTERSMALKYGREYIRNRRTYRDFAEVLAREDIKVKHAEYREELLEELAETENSSVKDDDVDASIVNFISARLAHNYLLNIDVETQTIEQHVGCYLAMLQNHIIRTAKELLRK